MNHEKQEHITIDSTPQKSPSSLSRLTSEDWEERASFQRELANSEFCEQITSELKDTDIDKQLEYLSLLYQATEDSSQRRLEEYYWVYGEGVYPLDIGQEYYNVINIFTNIERDNHVSPLSRIVSKHLSKRLQLTIEAPYVTVKNIRDSEEKQANLHANYPFFSPEEELIQIAPDTVASTTLKYSYEHLVELANRNGNKIKLSETTNGDNSLGLSEEDAFLLGAIHTTGIKDSIDELLGIKLEDINLDAQMQLLKFMSTADDNRLDKLCTTMHKIDKKMRLGLAENFLAADFGKDFGDALLDIVESKRFDKKEKERVLDAISSCRESVAKITGLYSNFDNGKFAKEYARASNERLTDAIMVFQQIAKNGAAEANLGWAGKPHFDYNKAIEALDYEVKSLKIISGTLDDINSGTKGAFAEIVMHPDSSNQRLNRTMYNFYSPNYGYVLLYTRPEGSHSFDPMVDYGKDRSRYDMNSINAGTEASISLITNPVDPYSLPSPYRPDKNAVKNPQFYNPITMDKVSAIRLDREGRTPGSAADSMERDPINPIGTVSVDLAAIGDREDTPSGKIARLLSVGGKLREETSGVNSSLNHNTQWFSQNAYGTSGGFRQLVEFIDKTALKWCEESKPGKDAPDNFTEIKAQLAKIERAKNRKRGRKAL